MKTAPPDLAAASQARGAFHPPQPLEKRVDEIIGRYPQKRSATMMVLHAIQEQFGYLSTEAIEWTAAKLGLQPIHVLELVTFYPMFRRQPAGKYHIKICRTLSCALAGAYPLREYLCGKLGLDPAASGPQTTADGRFTVEFVECLASCGTGPVLLCNDDFYEAVNNEKADAILARCK